MVSGSVNVNANTDITHSGLEVLHTIIAYAYTWWTFNQVFHYVYDTLKNFKVHHCDLYVWSRIYNIKWGFSEFSQEKLQSVI